MIINRLRAYKRINMKHEAVQLKFCLVCCSDSRPRTQPQACEWGIMSVGWMVNLFIVACGYAINKIELERGNNTERSGSKMFF